MKNNVPTGFLFDVEVREAPGKGLGVFTLEPIKAGQTVWRFLSGNYQVFDEPGYVSLLREMSHERVVYELTHCFAFEDFPDVMVRILDRGALINHAESANLATNFGVSLSMSPTSTSSDYLTEVATALLQDRFSLIATRDVPVGEELTNNYEDDVFDPPFYVSLCEKYGVVEDYFD